MISTPPRQRSKQEGALYMGGSNTRRPPPPPRPVMLHCFRGGGGSSSGSIGRPWVAGDESVKLCFATGLRCCDCGHRNLVVVGLGVPGVEISADGVNVYPPGVDRLVLSWLGQQKRQDLSRNMRESQTKVLFSPWILCLATHRLERAAMPDRPSCPRTTSP